MNRCDQFSDIMKEYLQEKLSPDSREIFENHLLYCEDCKSALEEEKKLIDIFQKNSLKIHSSKITQSILKKIPQGEEWEKKKIQHIKLQTLKEVLSLNVSLVIILLLSLTCLIVLPESITFGIENLFENRISILSSAPVNTNYSFSVIKFILLSGIAGILFSLFKEWNHEIQFHRLPTKENRLVNKALLR